MRRCAFLFAAFLLAGALLGCSSTQDIPKSKRTRALDAPAGDVVTATVEAVTAEGYTVESVDREAGLVTTWLLYTSPSPRDVEDTRMPSSA